MSSQAGLAAARSIREVEDAETALQLLVTRAAGIHEAKVARIRSVLSDVKQQFPIECYRERIAGFWGRFVYTELVVAERLKQERRSPTQQGLAVWAEADLVTPEILEQIPVCLRKVRCR